jgi:glycosyltransferase involved in cell wall biosynthesis
MRILFFSNEFPNPLVPTHATFNLALMSAVAARHPVRVVAPIPFTWELRCALTVRKKIRQRRVTLAPGLDVEYPRYYFTPRILRSYYDLFMRWSVGRQLERALGEFQPDAVVSYWLHPDGAVAVRAARRAGIPAITMVGGSDLLIHGRGGRRRARMLSTLHKADAVVAVSNNIARVLVEDGLPPDKVHVVRRGVDRALFCPGDQAAARRRLGLPDERKILVAVGRLVPVKGFEHLVDACQLLFQRGVNLECHVLGGGPLRNALQSRALEAGLAGRMLFRGDISQSLLPEWYRASDLVVLSSLSEGVPNVLLEAICCGKRFVATNVGGVAEVADPQVHTLVPAADPRAMADAIEGQLAMVAPRGPVRFEPHSWEESAAALCHIVEEILAARGSPAGAAGAAAGALAAPGVDRAAMV